MLRVVPAGACCLWLCSARVVACLDVACCVLGVSRVGACWTTTCRVVACQRIYGYIIVFYCIEGKSIISMANIYTLSDVTVLCCVHRLHSALQQNS